MGYWKLSLLAAESSLSLQATLSLAVTLRATDSLSRGSLCALLTLSRCYLARYSLFSLFARDRIPSWWQRAFFLCALNFEQHFSLARQNFLLRRDCLPCNNFLPEWQTFLFAQQLLSSRDNFFPERQGFLCLRNNFRLSRNTLFPGWQNLFFAQQLLSSRRLSSRLRRHPISRLLLCSTS